MLYNHLYTEMVKLLYYLYFIYLHISLKNGIIYVTMCMVDLRTLKGLSSLTSPSKSTVYIL